MGWFGSYEWRSAKDVHAEILRGGSAVDHASTAFGARLWTLERLSDGRMLIALYLVSSEGGEWGYKPISEDMGPFYYDCPKRILDTANAAGEAVNETAKAWRAQCTAERAKVEEAIANLPPQGSAVTVFGKPYTLGEAHGRNKMLVYDATGRVFAAKKADIRPA